MNPVQWRFELRGDAELLEHLLRLFCSSDPCVERHGDSFFLCSSAFDFSGEGQERNALYALNRAEPALDRLNIAASLYIRDFKPPWIGAEWYLSTEGWTKKSILLAATSSISKKRANPDLSLEPKNALAAVARLMGSDRMTHRILRAIQEADWGEPGDLYRIIDAIRKNVGGEKGLEEAGIASKREFGICKHSLTMRRKILPRAGSRPKAVMSLEEAEGFTREMAARWLHWKLEKLG